MINQEFTAQGTKYQVLPNFEIDCRKLWGSKLRVFSHACEGKAEGEVEVFSTKSWGRRSSEALIEFAIPCHDAQAVGPYPVANLLRLAANLLRSDCKVRGVHYCTTTHSCAVSALSSYSIL